MTASFLCCFDPQVDRLDSKRFAMWANLTKAFGIKLLLYGDPIPRTPKNTTIYPSIEHAQIDVNRKCLLKRQVEWVFMISPLSGRRLPYPKTLNEFTHPDEAVYVFGPDYEKNWEIEHFKIDHRVEVTTLQGTGELHALMAASIVAYDRWMLNAPFVAR